MRWKLSNISLIILSLYSIQCISQVQNISKIEIKYSAFNALFTIVDIPCEDIDNYIPTQKKIICDKDTINIFLHKINSLERINGDYSVDARCSLKIYEGDLCTCYICLSDNIVCMNGFFYKKDDELYKIISSLFSKEH